MAIYICRICQLTEQRERERRGEMHSDIQRPQRPTPHSLVRVISTVMYLPSCTLFLTLYKMKHVAELL